MTAVLTKRNRNRKTKSNVPRRSQKKTPISMEIYDFEQTEQESFKNTPNNRRSLCRFIYDLVISIWLFIVRLVSSVPILKPLDEQQSDIESSDTESYTNSKKTYSDIADLYSSSESSDNVDELYSSDDSDYDPEQDHSRNPETDSDEQDSDEYDSDEYDSGEYDSDEYDSDRGERGEYDSDEQDSDEQDSDEQDSDEYDSDEQNSGEYDSEMDVSEDITVLPIECVRRCRGVTSRKTPAGLPQRCKITNEMVYDKTRPSYTQEAALRMIVDGSNYCSYHYEQENVPAYKPSVHPVIYGIQTPYRDTMSSMEKQNNIQEAYENDSIPLDGEEAWKYLMDKQDLQKEYGVDKFFNL